MGMSAESAGGMNGFPPIFPDQPPVLSHLTRSQLYLLVQTS